MLRSTVKKLIAIVIIAIIFLIINYKNQQFNSVYPSLSEIKYNTPMFETKEDIAIFDFEHSTLAMSESINADRFDDCYYALLVNDTDKEFYVAKNIYERMYPASMTKLMTAIIVCEKIEAGEINLEDMVEINTFYDLTADGVLPSDIFVGYQISVKDLLYGLLLESNNYYALYLAEYVAGSEEEFCKLMNAKAKEIGATNTHYMNPHGLDHSKHYSTAYDTYLITKEAYKHDLIHKIDSFETYNYTVYSGAGEEINFEIEATNYFKNKRATLPANFEMTVWKTGTTDGAGNCLTMYLEKDDKSYIIIASAGYSKKDLYDAMVRMLCLIK